MHWRQTGGNALLVTLHIVQSLVEETELSKKPILTVLRILFQLTTLSGGWKYSTGSQLEFINVFAASHTVQLCGAQGSKECLFCWTQISSPWTQISVITPTRKFQDHLFYSYVFQKFFLNPKWKFVEHFLFCTTDFCVPDLEWCFTEGQPSKIEFCPYSIYSHHTEMCNSRGFLMDGS